MSAIAPINKKEKIEKMQISKKLYTTLIIAVLTLSTLMAAIPMASAEIIGDPVLVTKGGTTAKTSGPVGTQVDVVGNGTGGIASAFATVAVHWGSLSGPVLNTGDANNLGEYRITVTIPPATYGPHWIVVNDGETESGGAEFNVTAALSVDSIPAAYFPPTLALPGDDLAVAGHGYAPNDDITLFLNQTTDPSISYSIVAPTFHTNASGSFSGTITVPAIPMANFDVYVFNATDEAGNSATDMVTIDYYITCFPGSGPTGITIWISGRIASSVAYDLRFNGALIATGTTGTDGSYFETYSIPSVLSPGQYPIDIWWNLTDVRSVNFTVTAQPTISLGANSGLTGDTVTITGQDFVGGADITLYFGTTVVNSTDMDDRFGPTPAFGPYVGTFSEEFTVPSIAPGTYAVSVVDSWGATSAAGVFFTIYPTPLITVETRATEYYQGDLLSLYTWSNVIPSYDVAWEITDSTGNIYIQGDIYTSDWDMISLNSYMVPYYIIRLSTYFNNMIPDDAPVGVWNFTAYNSGTSAKIDTNLFSVSAKPDMQTVLDALNANTTTILDEIAEGCANMTALLQALDGKIVALDGTVATISTKVGTIQTTVSGLDAKITSINNGMATVQTSLGTVQTSLNSLDTVIGSMYGDVVTLQTAIGTFETSLDALDASITVIGDDITAIAGDIVTIETSLGTIDGTITDIEGSIATIETDLGTVKVDLAAAKTDISAVEADVDESLPVDMMPIWIAVVLSLVAAIAAIFAVVTIRQKIAG